MKSFLTFIAIILSLLVAFALTSCKTEEIFTELPPEVLPVPNEFGQHEGNFVVQAVDINESGLILGYSGASTPLVRNQFEQCFAFTIKKDKSGYKKIPSVGSYCTWAFDINDNGVVAGAYIPDTTNLNPGNFLYIPCQGYIYHSAENLWQPFSVPGKAFTLLQQVNNSGIAWGYCGSDLANLLDKEYFLYNINNSAFISFMPQGASKYVIHTMNDQLLVVSFFADGSEHPKLGTARIYSLPGLEMVADIPTNQFPDTDVFFKDVNQAGDITGFHYGVGTHDRGFVYIRTTGEIKFIPEAKPNQWNYVVFRPYSINDQGIITGITGRIKPGIPLPQNRAFIIKADLSGFEDITPPNRDVYADAYAINNNNEIVGYAGFWQGSYIANKAVLIRK